MSAVPEQILFAILGVIGLVAVLCAIGWLLWREYQDERELDEQARVAAIEAELDEKAKAMRERMFEIAEALHAEGHDARKAMIRASFIASGKLPGEPL